MGDWWIISIVKRWNVLGCELVEMSMFTLGAVDAAKPRGLLSPYTIDFITALINPLENILSRPTCISSHHALSHFAHHMMDLAALCYLELPPTIL